MTRLPAAKESPDQTLLHRLAGHIGAAHLLQGDDASPFCTDWRGLLHGQALAVLRPATTAEVAACVALCARHGVAVVPQGGNTGQVGGATPLGTLPGGEIVLSLARLNRLRALEKLDMVLIAEAGLTLQAAREAAATHGLDLPIGLGSQGSAQLGGVVSTNAGGTAVLRHGNARDLLLGLEVVLPDGRVWNGLRRLRKDNAGYALRHLFAGAEGTLGIITAVSLRLVPAIAAREMALAAVPSVPAALGLLQALRRAEPSLLSACEYISGDALRLAVDRVPGIRCPLPALPPHAVLVEFSASRPGATLLPALEQVLADAMASGLVSDAVFAGSEAHCAALWRLREALPEAQRATAATVRNDISVPLSAIPALIAQATEACKTLLPGIRPLPFGHLGDGNIHFNLLAPEGMDRAVFQTHASALTHAVAEVARALDGSFAAEHGVGQTKTDLLAEWRSGVELDLFHKLKATFDPLGTLNPGKVLNP